jgi:XTP/dITP diphosphohydrolase
MKLVLATWNKTKVGWLTKGFTPLNLIISSIDKEKIEDAEETGITTSENAIIKVRAVGIQTESIIIGEDSALSIDALDGFPGVKTARWMDGTDDDRSIKILEMMKDIPLNQRSAKFLSAIFVLFPNGEEKIYLGEMSGKISTELIGAEGKGYQRIFLLENGNSIAESGNTLIQPDDHRDQAIKKAIKGINNWLIKNER